MKLFRKKRHKEAANTLTRPEALAAIPTRSPSVKWEILDSGEIMLEYPLNMRPFFIQLANRFSNQQQSRPTKRLQLDAIGSRVWQMFNGEKDVKMIVKEVADQSGLSLQEAEISVTTFLRELGRRGLILMR